MSTFAMRAMLAAGCLLLFTTTVAATPQLIPVETFARHASVLMPRLSPDGKYVALRMDDGDEHALVVYQISDMSHPVSMLRMPKFQLPVDIAWVGSTRLIVVKGREFGSIGKPESTGEILATDVDGKHQDYLFGYKGGYGSRADTRNGDHGWGSIDGLPEPANNHFYMGAQLWNSDNHSWLYDVDAVKNTRHLIGDIGVNGLDFTVGPDGKAHFAYGTNNDFDYVVYHRQPDGWAPYAGKLPGHSLAPIRFAPDHQHIYAYDSDHGAPADLIEQDENGGDRKVLAKAGFGSIGDLQWTAPPLQPFAAISDTGTPQVTYIQPNLPAAKLYRALSLKFPGEFVDFINFSEDGKELLFSVSSDRDPGTYYLIDTQHYKVLKLFSVAPWINPAQMAERVPMHFKANDGLELEAILTVPNHVPMNNLPMVLLPHGGPHGISDTWFFDEDAQFLASRGYLVLQVNYRGSGGRGYAFKEAGYLKWGTRIQQDLIDGVKWAEAQHYADPKRVCVYGASFGGYSAMMSVIRAPGLFKCAVGYAGIYDLAMMYKKGDIRERAAGRSYLRTVIGRNDADLDANSPDKLADRIDVPVLLVHGKDDQRAPFAQAKAMRDALEAAHKSFEWLVKPGEGHGFYSEKDNVDFLNHLQAFLAKYIGPGAEPAN
ncbi:alpha/beta hydrolase family protein [Rhodanobacter glycinis]|uniref:Dipeptidyl aminopeptidase/acylaminoacyl peptidase n=1 Tax=Rhodanobacter glycinis TaxID=582702 RepID=A0A1I4BIJ9_9GAMM|nr:prolyl oligopeptidase family serine peptidase [Rhodanobacter glycinis]SFK68675.1 Dipeptidyl aminopeptidase/acylaminoacyl peptidase [Rhodanobacter glycinis]